jgi:hypothetical protein
MNDRSVGHIERDADGLDEFQQRPTDAGTYVYYVMRTFIARGTNNSLGQVAYIHEVSNDLSITPKFNGTMA